MKNVKPGIVVPLLALCLHMLSTSSRACSVVDGYLRPSNYDLVKETEVILLAEAASFDRAETLFTFNVLEVVKGNFTDKVLVQTGTNVYRGKGDEKDFRGARPGSGTGGCNAYDYQIGKKFLLFVSKYEGQWIVDGLPFSRINEEVSGAGSPWVVAVRHYARISSANDYESAKIELIKLQERARRGKEAKAYPVGLVADIDRYFTSAYPAKSYQDLMTLYDRSAQEGRRKVLWAFAQGPHLEAVPLVRNLMQSSEWEDYIGPISKLVEQTKDRSLVKLLASNYLKVKDKHERWPAMWALVRTAEEEDARAMLAALKAADEDEVKKLATWFVRHPSEEATQIIRQRVDERYGERWELTFSLAGLGDAGTLEWAKKVIASSGEGSDEDRWKGYYILAHSPLAEADELARAVIQGGEPKGLTPLIQGYKDSLNPNRWERLRDAVHLESRSPEVDQWLRRTLKDMASQGDESAARLLGKLN